MKYLIKTKKTICMMSDNGAYMLSARLCARMHGTHYIGSYWHIIMFEHGKPVKSINNVDFEGVRVCLGSIIQSAHRMGCFRYALLSLQRHPRQRAE